MPNWELIGNDPWITVGYILALPSAILVLVSLYRLIKDHKKN